MPQSDATTAVLLILPADGSSVIADGAVSPSGWNLNRKATWDDVYRMVCDVKSQLETMRTVSHHMDQTLRLAKQAQAAKQRELLAGKA